MERDKAKQPKKKNDVFLLIFFSRNCLFGGSLGEDPFIPAFAVLSYLDFFLNLDFSFYCFLEAFHTFVVLRGFVLTGWGLRMDGLGGSTIFGTLGRLANIALIGVEIHRLSFRLLLRTTADRVGRVSLEAHDCCLLCSFVLGSHLFCYVVKFRYLLGDSRLAWNFLPLDKRRSQMIVSC